MNIQEIFSKYSEEVLSDDVKTKIVEAFKAEVDSVISERTNEISKDVVAKALEEQDRKHAEELKVIIEKIDEEHAKAVEEMVKKIDEEHARMFESAIFVAETKNAKLYAKKAEKFQKKLLEKLDAYLENYLKESIPFKDLKEAVENNHAKLVLEKVKAAVTLDEEYLTENIKSAFVDAKKTIDKTLEEKNKLESERQKLLIENEKLKSHFLLTVLTEKFSPEKKRYVFDALKGKNESFIKENFEAVSKMFSTKEKKELLALRESATATKSKFENSPKDLIKAELNKLKAGSINESDDDDGVMSEYLESYKNL